VCVLCVVCSQPAPVLCVCDRHGDGACCLVSRRLAGVSVTAHECAACVRRTPVAAHTSIVRRTPFAAHTPIVRSTPFAAHTSITPSAAVERPQHTLEDTVIMELDIAAFTTGASAIRRCAVAPPAAGGRRVACMADAACAGAPCARGVLPRHAACTTPL
jgi:hypothetical protein